MMLLNKGAIHNFKQKHSNLKPQILSWEAEVEQAKWKTPHELKDIYPSASILGRQKVIFNIHGNKCRLLVKINFKNQIVKIEKIGTHEEYNKWQLF
jgi:mRNA interferase HigB